MSSSYLTRNNRTSKRGALINGVWHCDCDPRLPADKFQTKNGGKNHGRWFYTCQQPQHKRCPFFQWEDGAKLREKGAVLSNSRTEPDVPSAMTAAEPTTGVPQTPKKKTMRQTLLQLPVTPNSRPKLMARLTTPTTEARNADLDTSPTRANSARGGVATDDFDWSSGDDEDLASALDVFETPRKQLLSPCLPANGVVAGTTSPCKRTYSVMKGYYNDYNGDDDDGNTNSDVFTTPATCSRRPIHGLLSPPTIGRAATSTTATTGPSSCLTSTSASAENLTSQALSLLAPHNLPTTTVSSLTELLAAYELRTVGITKGRDLTRLALQQKDSKIAELQSSVHSLEQERAMLKNVISLLKSDLATNTKQGQPRKPRQPRQPRQPRPRGSKE